MKLSSARIIDPILTELALGYHSPENVGTVLFPIIEVGPRAGKVPVFTKDNFRIVDGKRAPGADTKRIVVTYGSDTYALVDESLDAQTPREEQEEAAEVPSIAIQQMAVEDVQELTDRNLEIDHATQARDAAAYPASNKITLGPGARFSDATVDPGPIFAAGLKAVRKKIGKKPNTCLLPSDVKDALRQNPFVQAQVQFTGQTIPNAAKITDAMLAQYIGVERVVEAMSVSLNETTDELDDIWGTDVILAWVNPRANNRRAPNFGYTFRKKGYPIVEEVYWEQKSKSWINGYTDSRQAKVTMRDAAYLIVTASD